MDGMEAAMTTSADSTGERRVPGDATQPDTTHAEAVTAAPPLRPAVVPTPNAPIATADDDTTLQIGWGANLIGWAQRHPRLPLLIALLIGLLARVLLVVRANAMIDGDEAMVGIQAERILHGQYPTYFYGQAYMGSLEAYLAALLFRIFGVSNWALRAVPVLLSLLLIYLTWRLARDLLPRDARTTPLLAGLAALLAAVPPVYDAVVELRTWGGQIEVYVITLALLVTTVELADLLRARATGARKLALGWLCWGFFAGLGFWVNPLISYALLTSALWLLPPLCARAFPTAAGALSERLAVYADRLRRRAPTVASLAATEQTTRAMQPGKPVSTILTPLLALPALALGGLPAWLYAIQNNAANIAVYTSQPTVSPSVSHAAQHGRLFLGAVITAQYAACVAPRVLNGNLPYEPLLWLPLRLALLIPPLLAFVTAIWLVANTHPQTQLRAGLPLLYAGVVTAVFCLGTSAWPAIRPCAYDQAGRYAVPLALVEPLLLLTLFALPRVWCDVRVWRLGRTGNLSPAAMRRGQALVLLGLLIFTGIHLGTYTLTDPSGMFQSPFYRYAPLDDSQLLTYLKDNHIHDAWCNHWIGNIITFQTNSQTVCADYYDVVVRGGISRPPGQLEQVSKADSPSFILALTETHPILAQELDKLGVTYTLAVLPQAGVTVITPDRTINPATVVNGLAEDYGMNAKR